MPPVGYIAYIDEAGDDGLKPKNPSERKSSDWMVISAVLIKANREDQVVPWTKDIIKSIGQHQLTNLHFRTLKDDKKLLVCEALSCLPIRTFSVLSHKRNMIGYRNIRAERAKVNRTAWFYCWMLRLLMEKITTYCGRRSIKDYKDHRAIRIELSDRGGVKLSDVIDYLHYIKDQSNMGMMYHAKYDLDWSVIDHDEIYSYPNKMRAGLQLSDCVASAFFAGLQPKEDGSTRPEFAKKLLPTVCLGPNRRRYGFGVRTMPTWVHNLPANQAELRDFYLKT
jgi:hypothetical protein